MTGQKIGDVTPLSAAQQYPGTSSAERQASKLGGSLVLPLLGFTLGHHCRMPDDASESLQQNDNPSNQGVYLVLLCFAISDDSRLLQRFR